MIVSDFLEAIGSDFFVGVPDSQLKALCDYLICNYGTNPKHHVIAANEGNAAAMAAGYNLSTGKVPVVYMQNSGEGNVVNPVASLLNDNVYAIPVIFIIGWRGEPGVKDEPQHVYQGKVTLKLLEDLNIEYVIVGPDTDKQDIQKVMKESFESKLKNGKQVAFVIKKTALSYDLKPTYSNQFSMSREDVLKHIVNATGQSPIVCTTGKASRELFEIRENAAQGHMYDFLTVGSMGHCSSIAFSIAVNKPNTKVWCIDGDGSAIMHLGAMAIIGANKQNNMVHIVLNNSAHDTVGGMPTVGSSIDWVMLARSCGYSYCASVNNYYDLDKELEQVKSKNELCFIEIKCILGARTDLGRPTNTPMENKNLFSDYIKNVEVL